MVRKLTADYIPEAIRIASPTIASSYKETDFYLPQNDEHMAQTWSKLVELGLGRAYGLFIADTLRGLLLGMICPDTISGWLHGYECFWGCEPKFRSRAVSLLRAFEAECKDAGCKIIVCTAPHGPKMPHMEQLYSALGYSPCVQAFSKML